MNGLTVTGLEQHRRAPGLIINVFQTTRTPNVKEKSSVIECDIWLEPNLHVTHFCVLDREDESMGVVKSFSGADKCDRLQLRRRNDSCSKTVSTDI